MRIGDGSLLDGGGVAESATKEAGVKSGKGIGDLGSRSVVMLLGDKV